MPSLHRGVHASEDLYINSMSLREHALVMSYSGDQPMFADDLLLFIKAGFFAQDLMAATHSCMGYLGISKRVETLRRAKEKFLVCPTPKASTSKAWDTI